MDVMAGERRHGGWFSSGITCDGAFDSYTPLKHSIE